MKNFQNLMDLMGFFHNEEKCHIFLKSLLWKGEKSCFFCHSHRIHEYKDFKRNRCYDCKKTFSIRKGTIFDDSKLSLQKWFMCIYLINSSKKGISSIQLAQQVGITQKSAWFVLQRLRNSVKHKDDKLQKEIYELDKCYIGGKAKNMQISKRIKKQGIYKKSIVLGIVDRKTKQVKGTTQNSLCNEIHKNIEYGSALITDEHKAYVFNDRLYSHQKVDHSKGEYVNNDNKKAFKIHTNTIEGFWEQLKRGVNGVHHWVSNKHVQRYIDEFAYSYNTKELANNKRFVDFLENTVDNKLTYKQLITC